MFALMLYSNTIYIVVYNTFFDYDYIANNKSNIIYNIT